MVSEQLRQRHERRLAKKVRRLRDDDLRRILRRSSLAVSATLQRVIVDPRVGWHTRGQAAQILATVEASSVVSDLLHVFFSQTTKEDLWTTALTLESLGDLAAVQPLLKALSDPNVHRRHAAARALGWIRKAGCPAATGLAKVLTDRSQPAEVRQEAAESLAYLHCAGTIEPLISVLADEDGGVRFWSVFALGGLARHIGDGRYAPRIIPELQRMLIDDGAPEIGWWSVGREALAMLGELTPEHRTALTAEIRHVLANPQASASDRRWAESYS